MNPMERDPLREALAEAIYDAMRENDPEGRTHPWVIGGNSEKQEEARKRADRALQAVPEAGSPCRHDAKWIEDYTRWAVEMDRRNRGDAIPAEPLDVERLTFFLTAAALHEGFHENFATIREQAEWMVGQWNDPQSINSLRYASLPDTIQPEREP